MLNRRLLTKKVVGHKMKLSTMFAFAAVAALAACTGGGPRTNAILNGDGVQKLEYENIQPYVLVDLTAGMAKRVSSVLDEETMAFFKDTGRPAVTIGSGDIVSVALVVNSDAGFIDFSQSQVSPISTTQLPPQTVGSDGLLNVPPIGRVQARGKSVQELENFLKRRLSEVLVNPTVLVNLVDRRSARVSVLGAVGGPGPIPLNQENSRVVETLAVAGGPVGRVENYILTLSRNGKSCSVPLQKVYENSRYNINLHPGDVISVEQKVLEVQVLGATSSNQRLEFDEASVTLSDVLATSGGLLNTRADLKGVFIYRDASRAAMTELGANTKAIPGDTVPTVFRVDMTQPTGLFTAARFEMQDEDIVYVADSLNADIRGVFGATSQLAPVPADYVRNSTIGNGG